VPINTVTTRDKTDTLAGTVKAVKAEKETEAAEMEDLDVVVFVVQADATLKKVNVKTGIQDINYIEITEGLKPGEKVVSGPYEAVSKTLKEKDKVKVVEKKDLFETK
jgi:HlyD family secretion protein